MVPVLTSKEKIKLKKIGKMFERKLISILNNSKNGKRSLCGKFKYMMINDFADLIRYSKFVSCGNFEEAYDVQSNLDSEVYEKIPDYLWNKIEYMNWI